MKPTREHIQAAVLAYSGCSMQHESSYEVHSIEERVCLSTGETYWLVRVTHLPAIYDRRYYREYLVSQEPDGWLDVTNRRNHR